MVKLWELAILLLGVAAVPAAFGGQALGWGDNSAGQLNFSTNQTYQLLAAAGFQSLFAQPDGTILVTGAPSNSMILPSTNGQLVIALVEGFSHGLALLADHTLFAFGNNDHGQATVPAGFTNFLAIGAGAYHSLAVLPDSTVITWGDNYQNFRIVPTGLSNVVAVAGGYYHSLALRADGTVVAWGLNDDGEVSVPAGLSNVVAIAAGGFHSVALRSDGTVVAWGRNDQGQSTVPVAATNVVAIAAGYQHALALKSDGSILGWGDNQEGEGTPPAAATNAIAIAAGYQHSISLLGTPPWPIFQQTPIWVYTRSGANGMLAALATAPGPVQYQWKFGGQDLPGQTNQELQLSNVQPNQAGLYTVIASANGFFVSAQAAIALETPAILEQPAPETLLVGAQAVFQVSAISSAPLRYQWQFDGANLQDATNEFLVLSAVATVQSGAYQVVVTTDGGSITSSAAMLTVLSAPAILTNPVDTTAVRGDTAQFMVGATGTPPLIYEWFFNDVPVPQATNSLFNLSGVAPGQVYVSVSNPYGSVTSTIARLEITLQNSVFSWGDNTFSESNVPPALGTLSQLACGVFRLMALKTNGTLVGWGENNYGQSSVPPNLTNAMMVSLAAHSLALRSDGTVVGWGYNGQGQTNVPTGLSNVVAVSAGTAFSLALQADGTVSAWGDNSHNQTNVPPSATNIIAIAAGEYHSAALKDDGTVVTWGQTNPPYHLPPAGLSNVIAIAAGYTHTLALLADSTVAAWGMNDVGQLSLPPGLSNVVAISAGAFDGLALKIDGTIVGLGDYDTGLDYLPSGLTNIALFSVGVAVGAVQYGPPAWPILSPAPVSQLASNGDTVTFSANAAAAYPLRYQWQFNGVNLSSETNSTLTRTNVEPANAGIYRVIVRGGSFAVTASAQLALNTPLLVLSASSNQSVLNGTNVTLLVSAIANSPINYQWKLDGAILPGQTDATLALANVQSQNAGVYSVLLSAGATSLEVPAGTLSVRYPPMADPSPQALTAQAGSTVTLQAIVSGPGPFTYQWSSFNGLLPPVTTNATLVLSNVNFSAQYVVTIANRDGVATNVFDLTVDLAHNAVADWTDYNPVVLPYPTNLVSISAGYQHLLAALADGTVQSYGANDFGQTTIPTGLSNVVQVAAGFSHSLALRRDGSVVGWGDDFSGQITIPSAALPVISIAAGKEFSLGLQSDGSLIAWGDNSYGQTNIPAIPGAVLSISAGYHHALALLMSGTVVGWGENSFGQASPPQGLIDVISIAAGGLHSLALTRAGRIVAWGDNTYGQLDVPAAATNVIAIAAGYANSLALRADGAVVRWGRGASVLNSTFVPTSIADVALIAAGYIDCVVATRPP